MPVGDVWGNSWASSWASSWKTATVTVSTVTSTGGIPRRLRDKREVWPRRVQIDGRSYLVRTPGHLRRLLAEYRAELEARLDAAQSEAQAKQVERKIKRVIVRQVAADDAIVKIANKRKREDQEILLILGGV